MTSYLILYISLHISPAVQTYRNLCRDITVINTEEAVEVKKLAALKVQLKNLPGRIGYVEMVIQRLQERSDFLKQMKTFAQSQMNDVDEKNL